MTSFILILSVFGLFAPVTTQAQGEDISLETLATYGGGAAAVVGLVGFCYAGYAYNELRKKGGELDKEKRHGKNLGMTVGEWCFRNSAKKKFLIAPDIDAINESEMVTLIKKDIAIQDMFEECTDLKSLRDAINREILYVKSVMAAAETCCWFMQGLSEENRLEGEKIDWRFNKFRELRGNAALAKKEPLYWNRVDYGLMQTEVKKYINSISLANGITKKAVKVWWRYFKKKYKLTALLDVVKGMLGEKRQKRDEKNETLADKQANQIAGASYGFGGLASANLNNPQPQTPPQQTPQPAPQPQPQHPPAQKKSWTSYIFNKWTVGVAATALTTVGLLKAGAWLFDN